MITYNKKYSQATTTTFNDLNNASSNSSITPDSHNSSDGTNYEFKFTKNDLNFTNRGANPQVKNVINVICLFSQ